MPAFISGRWRLPVHVAFHGSPSRIAQIATAALVPLHSGCGVARHIRSGDGLGYQLKTTERSFTFLPAWSPGQRL